MNDPWVPRPGEIVSIEDFLFRVEQEGIEYTLTSYYPEEFLKTIPDQGLRDKAISAMKAIEELEAEIERLEP